MGTELLLGEIIDTNSAYIARKLSSLGVSIFRKTTVGDNLSRIKRALEEAVSRVSIVIVSGGLGPTEDDVTREAVSEFFQKELVVDQHVLEAIEKRYAHYAIPRQAILKQSLVPTSAQIIPNPVGSAPGIIMEDKGKTVILLPGVPQELEAMVPQLTRHLSKKTGSQVLIKSRVLKVWGLGESQVNEKIATLMSQGNPTVALLAKKGEVHIRITARFAAEEVDRAIKKVESIVRERLGDYIFGADDESLEEIVARLLLKKNLTLALAESCSGGLIAHRLTNIPGISAGFLCAVVSYSNETKSKILKVSPHLINTRGAVCGEVAMEMAKGVRALTGSDIAAGVTGIAGPGGGTPEKPVGLVYIALSTDEGEVYRRYRFLGTRDMVKWRISQAVFDLLRRYLLGTLDKEGTRGVSIYEDNKPG